MRISTAEFFRLSTQTIQRAQSTLSEQQLQIASGQKLVRPSDDPLGVAQILELDSATRATEQFTRNAGRAQSRLALTEQTLADVTSNLQRVSELTVAAANDTQTNETRSAIATELRERLEELIATANARDADGEYIFAGNMTATRPFTVGLDGTVSYVGDDGQRFVSVDQGRQVALNESGNRVFMGVPEGNGTFALEANAGNSGSGFFGAGSLRDVGDFRALPERPDGSSSYTLAFDSDADAADDNNGDGLPDATPAPGFRVFAGDPIPRLVDLVDGLGAQVLDGGGNPIQVQITDGVANTDSVVFDPDDLGDPADSVLVEIKLNEDGSVFINEDGLAEVRSDLGNPVFENQLAMDADGNVQFDADGNPVLVFDPAAVPAAALAGTPPQIPYTATSEQQTIEAIPGIAFDIGGRPEDGDTFDVRPAASESIFATYAELIANLETPANSDSDKAQFRSRINASLANLNKALDHIIERRAESGGRQRVVETQIEINDDRELQFRTTRSTIADLDLAEAISNLQQQLVGLQAAQQSFLRIQNLSLFNLL